MVEEREIVITHDEKNYKIKNFFDFLELSYIIDRLTGVVLENDVYRPEFYEVMLLAYMLIASGGEVQHDRDGNIDVEFLYEMYYKNKETIESHAQYEFIESNVFTKVDFLKQRSIQKNKLNDVLENIDDLVAEVRCFVEKLSQTSLNLDKFEGKEDELMKLINTVVQFDSDKTNYKKLASAVLELNKSKDKSE